MSKLHSIRFTSPCQMVIHDGIGEQSMGQSCHLKVRGGGGLTWDSECTPKLFELAIVERRSVAAGSGVGTSPRAGVLLPGQVDRAASLRRPLHRSARSSLCRASDCRMMDFRSLSSSSSVDLNWLLVILMILSLDD